MKTHLILGSVLLATMFFTGSSAFSETVQQEPVGAVIVEESAQGEMLLINKADAEEIANRVRGVGIKKAEMIVTYREENGAFDSEESLMKVKGIGPKLAAKIASQVQF